MKTTPGRWGDEAGRLPLYWFKCIDTSIDAERRPQKRLGIGMFGRSEKAKHIALFDNLPGVHDVDAIAVFGNQTEVMRN